VRDLGDRDRPGTRRAGAPRLFEAALLRAVDELHEHSRILDQTWADLAAVYTVEQMLDLVFTIGQYHLVSFALNSCGVELDDGIADVL
jgi:alkylhydroperoxidase family enzyme